MEAAIAAAERDWRSPQPVPDATAQRVRLDRDPYSALHEAFDEAVARASKGKGAERHASGEPFEQQPIVTECIALGPASLVYQIRKKARECLRMDRASRRRELLDVMVYAAAAWIAEGVER